MLGLRDIPAVSMRSQGFPPISATSSTLSLVVPASPLTTALSSPERRFKSVLFPTLGLPTMASLGRSSPPSRFRPPLAFSRTRSKRSPTPRPWRAEMGTGSPSPSFQPSPAAASWREESALLTARTVGTALRRKRDAIWRSRVVRGEAASTSNMTASARSMAIWVCCKVLSAISPGPSFQPAVSTISSFFPLHSVLWTTRSRVALGRSEIIERLVPHILLASVLFPTLGLPTMAMFRAVWPASFSASRRSSPSPSSTKLSLSIMEQMREKTWSASMWVVSISITPGAGVRKFVVKRSDSSLEETSSSIPSPRRRSRLTALEAVRSRRRSALGAMAVVASLPSSTTPL